METVFLRLIKKSKVSIGGGLGWENGCVVRYGSTIMIPS